MTSLLDLGYTFQDEFMSDRKINSREYDACWQIFNVSAGLSSDYVTMANAIFSAMSILKSEKLVAWAKAHVAYLNEKHYTPTLPRLMAEWSKVQSWA
jgi:hypothetical protein